MGSVYPQELVERINDRTDIVQLIGEQLKLEKKGKDYWGLCPFHSEKTPSFSVSQDKQMYYCFGCHAGGNAVSFLMEHNKLSFPEVIEQLAERAGVDLPQPDDDGKVLEQRRMRERDLRIASWAAEVFHRQLTNEELGRTARDYMLGRGVSQELIEELKLGVSLSGSVLMKKAEQHGIGVDELVRVGLVINGENGHYDRFRSRVSNTALAHRLSVSWTVCEGASFRFDGLRVVPVPGSALLVEDDVDTGLVTPAQLSIVRAARGFRCGLG